MTGFHRFGRLLSVFLLLAAAGCASWRGPQGRNPDIRSLSPQPGVPPAVHATAVEGIFDAFFAANRIGLTPTPICSPGLASLRAALNPASTNYYYYALDVESGTHRFFTNMNEFNAFVATQNYGG